jgi:hypothetical protein
MVQSIWDLRNAIHNQLHPGVIDAIDRFFKDFPSYQRDGHTYLGKIQSILRKYYAVTASSLVETANSLELTEIADIANSIGQKEPSIEELVSLASAAANTRSQMSQIKPVKMAETILLLSNVSNYISSSMSKKIASAGNSMNLDTYKKLVEASVHLAYVEGLLITDNWSFLASEARSTNRPQRLLSDVIAFSTITLESAMELPLQKWSAVNSGMEYFVDSAIKSSSLNGAGQLSRVSIQ